MAKRVALVFVGVLLATAGFAAGWLTKMPSAPPSEPDTLSQRGPDPISPTPLDTVPKVVDPKDTIAYWCYPKLGGLGGAQPSISMTGGTVICHFIAREDITTVADWYDKKLGQPILVEQTSDGRFGRQGNYVATYDDSFIAGSNKPRRVKVGLGILYSKPTVVSVTLTQAEGEEGTHVVYFMLQRE